MILVTGDARVRDAVESTAAALGVGVEVLADVDAALRSWAVARVVLVGGDRAGALAAVGPRRRQRVFLVGFDSADLGTWSMPLGASVIPLPQGLAWLSGALASDEAESRLVAVVGGSGGVGASTLAAGLAVSAVRRGLAAALVDLDPLGGGADLLMGAERAPGWRWARLVGARGEVGDVRGVLPSAAGVTLVSMGRGDEAGLPTAEAVHAVVGSLGRHHDLVVVDPGRAPLPAAGQALRAAEATVLLSGGEVRAVAAAVRTLEVLDPPAPGLVLRASRGGPPPSVVADALSLPWWGNTPEDSSLPALAESGEPPGGGRGGWARAVDKVLVRVLEEAGHGD